MNVAFLDVEGVDPHLEDSLFLAALGNVIIKHLAAAKSSSVGVSPGQLLNTLNYEGDIHKLTLFLRCMNGGTPSFGRC